MLISARCKCGNDNKNNFFEYEGSLGYEAIICKECCGYFDNDGEHEADEWSKEFVKNRKKYEGSKDNEKAK